MVLQFADANLCSFLCATVTANDCAMGLAHGRPQPRDRKREQPCTRRGHGWFDLDR
ncbi:hypothetical protein KPATCC21470_0406 [Kitasatospora purpeofusca]